MVEVSVQPQAKLTTNGKENKSKYEYISQLFG